MWLKLLFIAGLVFFVDLLFIFFGLFGFLLTFVLLAFVSHSFTLGLCRVLNLRLISLQWVGTYSLGFQFAQAPAFFFPNPLDFAILLRAAE